MPLLILHGFEILNGVRSLGRFFIITLNVFLPSLHLLFRRSCSLVGIMEFHRRPAQIMTRADHHEGNERDYCQHSLFLVHRSTCFIACCAQRSCASYSSIRLAMSFCSSASAAFAYRLQKSMSDWMPAM